MTDKVQKIREEVERLKSNLVYGACSSQVSMETRCKEEAYNEVLAILDTMQEEPAQKIFEDMLNAKTPAESLGISAEEHDKIIDLCLYGKEPEMVDADDLPKEEPMPKFKAGDHIRPIDSSLGAPRTILEVCDGWYVTNQGTLDFEYEDNWELVREPVSEDLEVELNKYIKDHFTIDTEQLDKFGIEEKDYMYSMDKSDMLALVEYFTNWQKTKEEPVSEDLEKASMEWLRSQLDVSYKAYGEGKQMELTHFDGYAMLDAIEFGAQWQKNHLWKPADGDDLPDVDREVIALVGLEGFFEIPPDEPVKLSYKVVFAHRPPEYLDGKDIVTGKVTRNYPKTYDKGGWNIPNVKFWLDIELPKEIEL